MIVGRELVISVDGVFTFVARCCHENTVISLKEAVHCAVVSGGAIVWAALCAQTHVHHEWLFFLLRILCYGANILQHFFLIE